VNRRSVATDKMDNDSLVSLGRLGCGHDDGRRLRKHAQAVDDFILAVGELETHDGRENELGNNGMNRRVRVRCRCRDRYE
jgi:hypothetical protein